MKARNAAIMKARNAAIMKARNAAQKRRKLVQEHDSADSGRHEANLAGPPAKKTSVSNPRSFQLSRLAVRFFAAHFSVRRG